jgi:hypothetical protein
VLCAHLHDMVGTRGFFLQISENEASLQDRNTTYAYARCALIASVRSCKAFMRGSVAEAGLSFRVMLKS